MNGVIGFFHRGEIPAIPVCVGSDQVFPRISGIERSRDRGIEREFLLFDHTGLRAGDQKISSFPGSLGHSATGSLQNYLEIWNLVIYARELME